MALGSCLTQDDRYEVLFLLQVTLGAGDTASPVVQVHDYTPLDVVGTVRPEVEVPVCVCELPVDSNLPASIIPPPPKYVQEWEHSNILDFHSELDCRPHAVEVV